MPPSSLEAESSDMARAPLAGIRVADFTWVWAGPFCTLQLAHLGAEVIRVETATRLCVTRLLPPYPDMQAGTNRSGYFNQYNQGKKSITLDLKRPEAVEVARRLCAASDVVAENFAAGVMDRAGLGYETLRQRRPVQARPNSARTPAARPVRINKYYVNKHLRDFRVSHGATDRSTF